jgi:sugar (pentulose or hexulose) kinase
MALVLGVDLGTTSITGLALDARTGEIVTRATAGNTADITAAADRARGRSEWDAGRMAAIAISCMRQVADQLGARKSGLAGVGLTGQQHGVVVLDQRFTPVAPLVNWQDRRGEEAVPGTDQTCVQQATDLLGPDAPRRTGCRLATGYLAVTLFWMKGNGVLPPAGTGCFLVDYFASLLTGQPPVTDPTSAASSGILDIRTGQWDSTAMAALGLRQSLFPEIRQSGDQLGGLTSGMADSTGLPAGLPVFVGIGDNQASFLGSVASRGDTVLVNVGTGGQVSVFTEDFTYQPQLETRPFPRGGFLLVCAGLAGGRAYAVLERFFRDVGRQCFGITSKEALYPLMNQLAESVPAGAGGLRCEPFFAGTRAQPGLRASFSGVSSENFSPGHLTRSVVEGMARAFRTGFDTICSAAGRSCSRLVGAGNGMRENPLLAGLVAGEFGIPVGFPLHREEAAYGAALLAAVGAGIFPDLPSAGKLIRYTDLDLS